MEYRTVAVIGTGVIGASWATCFLARGLDVIASDPAADANFTTLSFPELVARDRRQWIVLVARISRQDARDALQRQQQANRYLII
jgi:3-hydroxyacyl-CoA dehydrogenase